jgi:hypothetical protein
VKLATVHFRTDAAATPYWLWRVVCGMRFIRPDRHCNWTNQGCDAATHCVQETLRDGSGVLIRAIRSDDKDRLREHARGLSSESVYIGSWVTSTL